MLYQELWWRYWEEGRQLWREGPPELFNQEGHYLLGGEAGHHHHCLLRGLRPTECLDLKLEQIIRSEEGYTITRAKQRTDKTSTKFLVPEVGGYTSQLADYLKKVNNQLDKFQGRVWYKRRKHVLLVCWPASSWAGTWWVKCLMRLRPCSTSLTLWSTLSTPSEGQVQPG